MTDKVATKGTSVSPGDDKTSEYSESSGKSPLEWLEIHEDFSYSKLENISGERVMLRKLSANPAIAAGNYVSIFLQNKIIRQFNLFNSFLSSQVYLVDWLQSAVASILFVLKIIKCPIIFLN